MKDKQKLKNKKIAYNAEDIGKRKEKKEKMGSVEEKEENAYDGKQLHEKRRKCNRKRGK